MWTTGESYHALKNGCLFALAVQNVMDCYSQYNVNVDMLFIVSAGQWSVMARRSWERKEVSSWNVELTFIKFEVMICEQAMTVLSLFVCFLETVNV